MFGWDSGTWLLVSASLGKEFGGRGNNDGNGRVGEVCSVRFSILIPGPSV